MGKGKKRPGGRKSSSDEAQGAPERRRGSGRTTQSTQDRRRVSSSTADPVAGPSSEPVDTPSAEVESPTSPCQATKEPEDTDLGTKKSKKKSQRGSSSGKKLRTDLLAPQTSSGSASTSPIDQPPRTSERKKPVSKQSSTEDAEGALGHLHVSVTTAGPSPSPSPATEHPDVPEVIIQCPTVPSTPTKESKGYIKKGEKGHGFSKKLRTDLVVHQTSSSSTSTSPSSPTDQPIRFTSRKVPLARKSSTDDTEEALEQLHVSGETADPAAATSAFEPKKEEREITGLGVKKYNKKRKRPKVQTKLAPHTSSSSTSTSPTSPRDQDPLSAREIATTVTHPGPCLSTRGEGRGAGRGIEPNPRFPFAFTPTSPPVESAWATKRLIMRPSGDPTISSVEPQAHHSKQTPLFPQSPPVQSAWQQLKVPQSGPPTIQSSPPSSQSSPSATQFSPQATQSSPSAPLSSPSTSQQSQQETSPALKEKKITGGAVKIDISKLKIPRKIEGGMKANYVKIVTNYLPMTIKPMHIHRYDVTITPMKPKKVLPKVFEKVINENYPGMKLAFDQVKNFYSTKELPDITDTAKVFNDVEIMSENSNPMKFTVSIQKTGVVYLQTLKTYMDTGCTSLSTPAEAIQCVDVVLRQGTLLDYVKSSHNYFKRPSNPIDLGEGLEMWTGLFQSALFTTKPYINIDVAHKGFPRNISMLELLRLFHLSAGEPLQLEEKNNVPVQRFKKFVKGLRVVASILGTGNNPDRYREYMCNDILASSRNLKFKSKNKTTGHEIEMTVEKYFKNEKGYTVKNPHLNCLWLGPRDKTIYYPMELLRVASGQVRNKQLTDFQLSKLVREAATEPNQRVKRIRELMQSMQYSTNEYFKEFGLTIDEKFTNINAKLLSAPDLAYCGDRVTPREGRWSDRKMFVGVKVSSWGMVAVGLDQRESNSETGIKELVFYAKEMGMGLNKPDYESYNIKPNDIQKELEKAVSKSPLQLLVVIIPKLGKDIYSKVKKAAEVQMGILTQCVKDITFLKPSRSTMHNILFKINSKLMGINHVLYTIPPCIQSSDVMVVGVDVTHPSRDQSTIPSIAAVTASFDKRLFHYHVTLSLQTPKKEMIIQFENMMREHISLYKRKNNTLPKKIFVFRDGVSEGQFAQVMHFELSAVYEAYKHFSQTKPQVLFLLVQKRHHTRFFVCKDNIYGNVQPGTVVDTDIVHASELDFYLVSHSAIKGTARPTRYHSICNDAKLPDTEVEQLAFYLCHLYSRCARSVSYPTPTYYAHLACLRARALTKDEIYGTLDQHQEARRLEVGSEIISKYPMFFV